MNDYIEAVRIVRDDSASEADCQAAFGGIMERFGDMVRSCAIVFSVASCRSTKQSRRLSWQPGGTSPSCASRPSCLAG